MHSPVTEVIVYLSGVYDADEDEIVINIVFLNYYKS